MRAPITLDLHVTNFNYPGVGPDQLFDKLVEMATTVERSGFSSLSVMDHLHQIPVVGPPENWMLEGTTILAGIAARTSTLTLGTLVGGVTYRNPAILAKATTTLDIISGGRAWFGIGAAWFEDEHNAYGVDFPALKVRFEHLEDCLQIARAMFTEEQATVDGTHHSVAGAYNNPKPLRGDIPIVIGGSGEKKTLRMVAQYADGCNLFGTPEEARHKLDVLYGHCERLGRDPAEITKTGMGFVIPGRDHEHAEGKVELLKQLGFPEWRLATALIGDADTLAEKAQAYADVGIEGMTLNIPDNFDPESLEIVGRAMGPVFAGAGAGAGRG